MSRTAEVLGVERSNLYRKMRAFGIAPARRADEDERSGVSRTLSVSLASRVLQDLIGLEASICR